MMSISNGGIAGCPEGPPPRTHGTPNGFRNIRVLAPNPLHFRLVAYAGLSMLSLNEFILKVLHLATPIDPTTGRPVPVGTLDTAPSQRCAQGPPGLSGEAVDPCVAPSPGAPAPSRNDQPTDPSPSRSFPTFDPVESRPRQDFNLANAGGHADA